MSEFLLATKTHIPPLRSHLVNRPRLIQRLNDGLRQNNRLSLVSAPAGFGKTTLINDWIRQADIPSAWLSLDKGDNDPVRFITHLAVAIQGIAPEVGNHILAMMQLPQPSAADAAMSVLINDMAEIPMTDLQSPNIILVMEDYHEIIADAVHDTMIFLIDHIPQQLHLAVTTRVDPPWPLARLRARQEITELRAHDLRFTSEETSLFLNEIMHLNLSPESISMLDARTEGWIAGLQLAAVSMQGRDDPATFIQTFRGTHRFVLDYLLEEVLSQQTPDVLNFLLRTSILEHLTAPLCDAITDSKGSQAILARLEASNMFLTPLDDDRQWYRYHRLFSDMLQSHLNKNYAEIIPDLHFKACTWYTQNGFLPKALIHAVAANSLDCLVKLVEEYAFTIFDVEEASALLSWLNTLPEGVMDLSPWLQIAHAWLLAYLGQVERVEQSILAAEKLADHSDQRLMGYIESMWTLLAELNYPEIEASTHANRALELLPQTEYRPRAFVAYHLSNILSWKGDIELALSFLENASTWSLAAGDYEMAMIVHFQKASILYVLGQLTESLEMFERTFRIVASNYPDKRTRSLPVGFAYLQVSMLYLEWNKISEALYYANKGIQICRSWGYSDYLFNGLVILADVLFVTGDLDGALNTIREARHIFPGPAPDRANALQAAIQLARGDLASASEWAVHCEKSLMDEPVYEYRTAYFHLATILQAQGRLREAYDILERIKSTLERVGAKTALLEALAQQSVIRKNLEEDDQALELLQLALQLGESEGHIRPFIGKGIQMTDLLREAAARGISPTYVSKLLRVLEKEGHVTFETAQGTIKSSRPSALTSPLLIEPLTERELEILPFLRSSLSLHEIAEQMTISVNTARSHIKHIYGKFDVHSRSAAIAHAEKLGLL